LTDRVTTLQAQHPQAKVEVRAEDEARLGLKPILRRVWAPRGQRPLADSAHRYEWLYTYGFVEPATGRSEWMILPTVRTDVMALALRHFAQQVGAGPLKQVVLVLDQAGWHTSSKLELPAGLHLLPLPAHTPELQPAERLWPLLREVLANEGFPTLDVLETRLVSRCQILSTDPALIKAHTHFHWWPIT
jgi:transposase